MAEDFGIMWLYRSKFIVLVSLLVVAPAARGAVLCSDELMLKMERFGYATYTPDSQLQLLDSVLSWEGLSQMGRFQIAVAKDGIRNLPGRSVMIHLKGDVDHAGLLPLLQTLAVATPHQDRLAFGRAGGPLLILSVSCLLMSGCNAAAYADSNQPVSLALGWGTALFGLVSTFLTSRAHRREMERQRELDRADLKRRLQLILQAYVYGVLPHALKGNYADVIPLEFFDSNSQRNWRLFVVSRTEQEGEPETLVLQTRY
jgi:hypothetical protein